MAQAQQVIHRAVDARNVIHPDVTDQLVHLAHVQKYRGYFSPHQLVNQRGLHLGRHDRHAFYLALQHAPDAQRHPR